MDYQRYYRENAMITNLAAYTPNNLKEVLSLIEDSVSGEKKDEMFYNYLISVAPSKEARDIITGIKGDEIKHNKMFRTIYNQLTNQILPEPVEEDFVKPLSYCAGIKKALKGELGAVEKYRKIMFAMENRVHENMVFEIITDELRHGSLYNLLFSLAKCKADRYFEL